MLSSVGDRAVGYVLTHHLDLVFSAPLASWRLHFPRLGAPCFQAWGTEPLVVILSPAKNLSDTPAHPTRQRRSLDKLILHLNPGAPGVSETYGRRE